MPATPTTLMNNLIKSSRFGEAVPLVLLSVMLLMATATVCNAIDPRKHQIEIQEWGALTNGMQLGFGVDKKELGDLETQYVTVEFVIKNTATTRRDVVELGSHKGIFFFSQGADGRKNEMLGISFVQRTSMFEHIIGPSQSLILYLRLKRTDLLNLAAASAFAQITVREEEENVAVPIVPFKIQVAIVLPH